MTETSYSSQVIKIGNSLGVTIPVNIASYLKINPGDSLNITIERNEE